jgi:3-hydroxyisobutyrate dehydrogenase-like beta-hydroxyacid dehydrogenase
MEVMAESLTLAEKAGVDSSVALNLLGGQSPQFISKSIASVLTTS